jgi:hypothetical protein
MQTNRQVPGNFKRVIALLAIVTVTVGIVLAAYDVTTDPAPRALPTEVGPAPVDSSPARLIAPMRFDATTPRFERSNEPAIEVDSVNAHGG